MAVFVSVRKEEEKNEETKLIFGSCISRKRLKRFCSNLVCGVLKLEGVSTAKIVLFHQGSTELRRCENCIFVLPVNIFTGVARWLFGPHDTLPCVLMCKKFQLVCISGLASSHSNKLQQCRLLY